jgi:hypothetical protein
MVQKRRQAQTVDLGSFSADWSLDARTLINRFISDNYLLLSSSFSASAPDRVCWRLGHTATQRIQLDGCASPEQ